MQNTIQISIGVNDAQVKEELIAQLSVLDYYAFEENEDALEAFINEDIFSATGLEKLLSLYRLSYTKMLIEDQNWNALWESNFQPVVVEDFCVVRAHFHEPFSNVLHEIVITPKMSFGTGHHATTYMMLSEMSKLDFRDKRVADFGTGTGVLAILAEKLGSKKVWAIDNDDWSIENSKENIERNDCTKVVVEKTEGFITNQQFDIILANINKSVILSNVDGLLFGLNSGGEVLVSGLLTHDEADVVSAFEQRGLKHQLTVERNNWICMLLKKTGL